MTKAHLGDFSIPIYIEEQHGLRRDGEAFTIGVPLPRGLIWSTSELVVTDSASTRVPHQTRSLARWSDRSIKWVLVDSRSSVDPFERTTLFVRRKSPTHDKDLADGSDVRVVTREGAVTVDTGAACFEIRRTHPGPFESVTVGTVGVVQAAVVRLLGRDGAWYEAKIERLAVEDAGPFRATVVTEGGFEGRRGSSPLRFRSRMALVAGSAAVLLDFQIRNTQSAVHAGGTWDLGDPGSWHFDDLTLSLSPSGPVRTVRWYAEQPSDEREQPADQAWSLYQDSSGGENWDSPNHVDARSRATVSFRGYRINGGSADLPNANGGDRATPSVTVVSADAWFAASVKDFWQNFPKALRWRDGALSIGLFPGEVQHPFELQGGEQKRHTILLDFGPRSRASGITALQHPTAVWVHPAWIEKTEAIAWFAALSDTDDVRYADYMTRIIEGPDSFLIKREVIDEYGWRNFGDLYGDHEAVRHSGPQRFISHYNNQYDFVYGAFVHFERSGDARWRQLLDDAARHLIDIDIYHTQRDKAAFNGGLFWHTDHYLPARTSTHRTYSCKNGPAGAYGGGPSNEHNYTTGLLYYYYLTGDREAADAVRELAEWVLGMDDGARTLFGLIDSGPTGAASKTLEPTFHRPGRGAGNSVNALLDGYTLSRQRPYLAKAEEIIQRCIHPNDDIDALGLDDPEHRWSYLVFLQILGKYLAAKLEMKETDYAFHYARASFVHYAAWVAEHEVPYKEVLHKVELPTETWPAHDIRKSHVLYVAAGYSTGPQRERFLDRAAFFFGRCMTDLLEFSTAYVTRPQVILCVHGSVHDYFQKCGAGQPAHIEHNHDFGAPSAFVPQRARVGGVLKFKLQVLIAELSRLLRDKLHVLRARMRRSR